MANVNTNINVKEAANGFIVEVYYNNYDDGDYGQMQVGNQRHRNRSHIAKTMDEVKEIVNTILNVAE